MDDEQEQETVIQRQKEEELKQKRLDNLRKAREARKKKEAALPPAKKMERIEVYEPVKEGNGPFKFALISLLGLGIMALFSGNRKGMSDAVAPASSSVMKQSKEKEPEVVYEKEPTLYDTSANVFFNSIEPMGRSW